MSDEKKEVICQNVWKVFGPDPESVWTLINNGMSKQEVLEKTGHVIAVKDVSFEINESEIFVIMGLSGSGKSTLVRCLNRLIEPTKGEIFIEGADLTQMSDDELKELRRHTLSMIFQNFGLLPHRSVLDNIAFGLEIRGESKKVRHQKAMQTLEIVGLKGWEKNRTYELSGGMQQRVGLARALAVDSKIVLMDEPFSALDPLIRRQMQDEFINLRSLVKKTVIFITHDLLEALKLGDRIAIMRDGEIVQIGTPEEIVTSPADDYVSEFVKDIPRGKVVTAESIMEPPRVLIKSDDSIESAIEGMKTKRSTVAFIVDADNKFKGIITMEQAISASRNGSTKAGDIVQPEAESTLHNTPVEQCLNMVADGNIPIAVLSEEQRLLGIITRPALINAMDSGSENHNENK